MRIEPAALARRRAFLGCALHHLGDALLETIAHVGGPIGIESALGDRCVEAGGRLIDERRHQLGLAHTLRRCRFGQRLTGVAGLSQLGGRHVEKFGQELGSAGQTGTTSVVAAWSRGTLARRLDGGRGGRVVLGTGHSDRREHGADGDAAGEEGTGERHASAASGDRGGGRRARAHVRPFVTEWMSMHKASTPSVSGL
ncbi:MAG: hypothetical protein R2710_21275 [Acidimicrobiales bacterium]